MPERTETVTAGLGTVDKLVMTGAGGLILFMSGDRTFQKRVIFGNDNDYSVIESNVAKSNQNLIRLIMINDSYLRFLDFGSQESPQFPV